MIRKATAADVPLLEAMLLEAVNWDASRPALSRQAALAEPTIAHYVAGWPRAGDLGVVAEDDETGSSIGAAWLRLFDEGDRGYGFVAADVPEVSLGVVAERRGQGVGTAMLTRLHDLAALDGHHRLSLSVEVANPARALYDRLGYRPVGDVAGGALTMVLSLRP